MKFQKTNPALKKVNNAVDQHNLMCVRVCVSNKFGFTVTTLGSSMKCIASTNLSSENSSTRIGAGPTPLARTRSPQKGWSPKKGIMVVGHLVAENKQPTIS